MWQDGLQHVAACGSDWQYWQQEAALAACGTKQGSSDAGSMWQHSNTMGSTGCTGAAQRSNACATLAALLLLLPLPPLVCQGHARIWENQLEKIFV